MGRGCTTLTRGLGEGFFMIDCRLGCRWLDVGMRPLGWASWTTRVMDIRLETWSMSYAGT